MNAEYNKETSSVGFPTDLSGQVAMGVCRIMNGGEAHHGVLDGRTGMFTGQLYETRAGAERAKKTEQKEILKNAEVVNTGFLLFLAGLTASEYRVQFLDKDEQYVLNGQNHKHGVDDGYEH